MGTKKADEKMTVPTADDAALQQTAEHVANHPPFTAPAEAKPMDPMAAALEKFGRRATALLSECAEASKAIEQRLTERAEARAGEQSKAMRGYDAELRLLTEKNEEYGWATASLAARQVAFDKESKEIKRRIGEVGEQTKATLATCRDLDAKAGERFGKRMEALGAQVAPLVAMGKRLRAVEQTTKTTAELALATSRDLAASFQSLHERVSVLEKLTAPPKEKPAKDAAAKAGS